MSVFSVLGSQDLGVGGTDETAEGVWTFENGTTLSPQPPFASTEPTNNTDENCLLIQNVQDGLSDYPCLLTLDYVLCEQTSTLFTVQQHQPV